MNCSHIIVHYDDTEEECFDILEVRIPKSAHVTGPDLLEEIYAAYQYDPVIHDGRMDAAERAFSNVIVEKYGGEWNYVDITSLHLYFGKDDA